jgi:hypothetical protein
MILKRSGSELMNSVSDVIVLPPEKEKAHPDVG